MDISEKYLLYLFENKQITADIYNNQVVMAIEQGIIKDITDKDKIMQQWQIRGAILEFPNSGKRFHIAIFNPPDIGNPDNRYNYQIEIQELGKFI
jgi:hypothetical protein